MSMVIVEFLSIMSGYGSSRLSVLDVIHL